jgi:hypothetical protein
MCDRTRAQSIVAFQCKEPDDFGSFHAKTVVGGPSQSLIKMIPASVPPQPLRGLKVAVTVPPDAWFGSVDYKFALDMIRNLEEMGADLIRIDIARLTARDAGYVDAILSDLRAFQPDVALSTPIRKDAIFSVTYWRFPRS